jgi:hypothetical protein
MTRLPDPHKPTAPQAGQPTTHTDQQRIDRIANAFSAALDEIDKPTAIRVTDPSIPSWQDGPRIGTTPPADQPGTRRPPMSQRAVDLNTTILSSSVLAAVLGGSGTAVMWASGHANPTVIAWICGCAIAVPTAIAIPVLALKSLMKSAKEVVQAAPPQINQYYNGTVNQEHNEITSHTKGLIASTRNDQSDPRA